MSAARRFTLPLIAALHLAAIVFWPSSHMPAPDAARKEMQIAFVKAIEPPKRVAPELPRRQKSPQPPAKASPPVNPASVSARQNTVVAIPEPVQPVPPMPLEAPAEVTPSRADVMAQALAGAGKADREARQSSLNMAERKLVLAPSRRERLIGEAFIDRAPPRIIEEVMPDGRLRSRRGNMCAYKESNVLMGGRDVIRDGVKTRWEQCPS